MNVLLSIKPKYADAILRGEKRYEFRKTLFKRTDIDRILIYSSSPVKKIVGSFEVGKIVEGKPTKLWDELSYEAGIDEAEFFEYYENKDKGFAIEITNLQQFDEPIDPKQLNSKFVPPQSFCYIE